MSEEAADAVPTLREMRARAGLLVKELAHSAGVTRMTLWRWESGFADVPSRRVRPLARALGVGVETVLEAVEAVRE